MYINSWDNVALICGNHKENHEIQMKLKQGPHSLFYSCPEYKSIYGNDHNGKSCNNRLTLVDYEDMLNHLNDKAMGEDGLTEVNLQGYRWNKKGVYYEVLECIDGHYKVLMLNKKAICK